MEKNYNSPYYKYIEKALKPHPKFTAMRWAVFGGKHIMTVIMEIEPGVTRERPKEKQPHHPFTGGGPHFHADTEQLGFLLGPTRNSPPEGREQPVYTISKNGNELARTGSDTILWLPRYTVHDIKISPEENQSFMDEYYPHGYPPGLKYLFIDVFSPIRQDYIDYFNTQPMFFED